jgi:hypothetical protein
MKKKSRMNSPSPKLNEEDNETIATASTEVEVVVNVVISDGEELSRHRKTPQPIEEGI